MTACRLAIAVWAAAAAAVACGTSTGATPTPTPAEVLTLRLQTAHFRVWAGQAAADTLSAIADQLEREFPRLSADLGVADLPVTTVEVWTDRESYYADMVATIGRRYDGSTGYVAGATNVTILDGANAPGRATHELAHCVSLRVNPTIGNNPRWLWETVALYENGERVDPRTLASMQGGAYPTLEQLNSDFSAGRQIYDVGYLLGEFIVATWGRDGLVRLIQANGDTARTFGLTPSEFEQQWVGFVWARYPW
jgi:hypothetical protein